MPFIWSPDLEALKRVLRTMPEQFAKEADRYAEAAVKGAEVAIRQVYAQHWVTGTLTSRVYSGRYTPRGGKLVVGWKVRSAAPHAWLFEHTTKPRWYRTKNGKIHATGRMWKGAPPPETFVPTVMKFRREMYRNLKGMLERAGLLVRGDAG